MWEKKLKKNGYIVNHFSVQQKLTQIVNQLCSNKDWSIPKTKIMASGPITSWQIDGETMEIVRDFIILVSKITADSDCSHEIKCHEIKMLTPWKKSYDQPRQHIKKQRHYFADIHTSSHICGFSCSHG